MANRIQLRRDTAANWTSSNPVLASGEYGFETDTRKNKIGNGVTAWNSLAYQNTNNYRGLYISLAALEAAIPTGSNGDYADVDAGAGSDIERYIWDANEGWVLGGGGGGGGTWGGITGTLSDQTDLQSALDDKADASSVSNVDNTSDANKPVSTAQQAALDTKMNEAEVIRTETTHYTLEAVDFNEATLLIMNSATGVNVTVAPSVAAQGKSIRIKRINTGQITFVQGALQVVTPTSGQLVDAGENGIVTLTYEGSNQWDLQNGFVNTAVPPTRTIAGVDLVNDITSSELNVALATMFSNLLTGSTNNRFHGSSIAPGASLASTTTLAIGSLKASPIIVGKNRIVDRIQAEVTTFGASSKLRLGIYADDGNGYPGALVVDSGEIDAGSDGVKTATINASLTPGIYWLACLAGTLQSTYRSEASPFLFPPVFGYVATMGSNNRQPYWVVAQAYGALPNPFPVGATINAAATNIPIILIRYAS